MVYLIGIPLYRIEKEDDSIETKYVNRKEKIFFNSHSLVMKKFLHQVGKPVIKTEYLYLEEELSITESCGNDLKHVSLKRIYKDSFLRREESKEFYIEYKMQNNKILAKKMLQSGTLEYIKLTMPQQEKKRGNKYEYSAYFDINGNVISITYFEFDTQGNITKDVSFYQETSFIEIKAQNVEKWFKNEFISRIKKIYERVYFYKNGVLDYTLYNGKKELVNDFINKGIIINNDVYESSFSKETLRHYIKYNDSFDVEYEVVERERNQIELSIYNLKENCFYYWRYDEGYRNKKQFIKIKNGEIKLKNNDIVITVDRYNINDFLKFNSF